MEASSGISILMCSSAIRLSHRVPRLEVLLFALSEASLLVYTAAAAERTTKSRWWGDVLPQNFMMIVIRPSDGCHPVSFTLNSSTLYSFTLCLNSGTCTGILGRVASTKHAESAATAPTPRCTCSAAAALSSHRPTPPPNAPPAPCRARRTSEPA